MVGAFIRRCQRFGGPRYAGLMMILSACRTDAHPTAPVPENPDQPDDSPVAAQLVFQTPPASGHPGVLLNPVGVVVQNAQGDVVVTSSVSVTIVLEDNPAGGVLSGTTTVDAVNGVATFADLALDRSAEYTLLAEAPSLPSVVSPPFEMVFALQQVSAGCDHSCGIAAMGETFCWGHNNYGQLGAVAAGDRADTPVAVDAGQLLVVLEAGGGHTCGSPLMGTRTAGATTCRGNWEAEARRRIGQPQRPCRAGMCSRAWRRLGRIPAG